MLKAHELLADPTRRKLYDNFGIQESALAFADLALKLCMAGPCICSRGRWARRGSGPTGSKQRKDSYEQFLTYLAALDAMLPDEHCARHVEQDFMHANDFADFEET